MNTSKTSKYTSVLLSIVCVMLTAVLVLTLAGCGKKKEEYVPEYQKETTIISEYYQEDENGRILPTAADKHDIQIIEGGGENADEMLGKWTDEYEATTYIFDGIDRGILLTGEKDKVDNRYTFTYSAQDGKLRIDIDSIDGDDFEYAYSISGDKLVLTRGGQTYNFTKVAQ